MAPTDQRGQVLVIVALALVVLLGASAFTIDLGRRAAEERFLQNAADAAALAACNAIIDGATEAGAIQRARDLAAINLASSPAGSIATLAGPGSETFVDGYSGNPYQLTNGVMVADDSVFVAIDSTIGTTIGQILGRESLSALGRARCGLEAEPLIPFVARRYQQPPGPGSNFRDHVATELTSGNGAVDPTNPRGYGGRTPASELAPGPEFDIFSPQSDAVNSAFRGFIALDVRDFTGTGSRKYYNGATDTMSSNVLKNHHARYFHDGYPGPGFPMVQDPPTGATQVGVMTGTTNAHTTQPFSENYAEGDRIMLALYNGTVMSIPDFSIQPPPEIALPTKTSSPVDVDSFTVSRNNAFMSTVTFALRGDTDSGNPAYEILPATPVTPPDAGFMNEPTFSPTGLPSGFNPKNDRTVEMLDISTEDVPEGIYAVWLEGQAGAPYNQIRRQPVPVRIGTVTREFSLTGSILDAAITTLGGSAALPIAVADDGPDPWNGGAGVATSVQLSWDTGSLTDCSHNPAALGTGSITISPTSVSPQADPSVDSPTATLTINSGSLAAGCYQFALRAQGINDDGQPVVQLHTVEFTVAATTGPSEYVDVIGFAVFEITDLGANSIAGRAITGIYADPNDIALRAALRPRLIPWN